MGSPTSQVLVKRSAASALMAPPPPPTKRQRRPAKVVDEDTYSQALSHIVARDFFPGLLETEAQSEYIQALDSNNNDWIREAGRKLTAVMTPGPSSGRRGTSFTPRRRLSSGDTPRTFWGHTPSSHPAARRGNDFTSDEQPTIDINMSLGAFQSKYTNEDNESFNAILDKQNQRRVAKYEYFHNGNKILAPREIAHQERERKLLESSGQSASTALITTNAAGEERRALGRGGPSQDLDARPASVDSFPDRTGPKNTFMFGPDGVEDSLVTHAQNAEARSNAPPKATNYRATRFSTMSEHEQSVPPSPSMSAVDAAILGRPKPTESEPGYSGADTPRVNGYTFVDAEPTPSELGVPVTDEEADAADRKAASKLLPEIDSSGPNPFRINERSKREDLHHRMVEKHDASRRKGGRLEQLRSLGITSGNTPGRTPTPKFGSSPAVGKKQGFMTPAAQSLAARLGTPKRNSEDVFGDNSRPHHPDCTPISTFKRLG